MAGTASSSSSSKAQLSLPMTPKPQQAATITLPSQASNNVVTIKSFVRLRPALGLASSQFLSVQDLGRVTLTVNNRKHAFSYDSVLGVHSNQADIIAQCRTELESARDMGAHVNCIGYGQSGSGKTYTLGTDAGDGLIQRCAEIILPGICVVSFIEVYGERIYDLLNDRAPLQLALDGSAFTVPDAEKLQVFNTVTLMDLVQAGCEKRSTAPTGLNSRSSRSHAILSIVLPSGGTITFTDLAGSERLKNSGIFGAPRSETQDINSQLSTLTQVLRAISKREDHIPYRRSTLTKVLKASFSRGAKICLIGCISTDTSDLRESLHTLRFIKEVRGTHIVSPQRPHTTPLSPIHFASASHEFSPTQRQRAPNVSSFTQTTRSNTVIQTACSAGRYSRSSTDQSIETVATSVSNPSSRSSSSCGITASPKTPRPAPPQNATSQPGDSRCSIKPIASDAFCKKETHQVAGGRHPLSRSSPVFKPDVGLDFPISPLYSRRVESSRSLKLTGTYADSGVLGSPFQFSHPSSAKRPITAPVMAKVSTDLQNRVAKIIQKRRVEIWCQFMYHQAWPSVLSQWVESCADCADQCSAATDKSALPVYEFATEPCTDTLSILDEVDHTSAFVLRLKSPVLEQSAHGQVLPSQIGIFSLKDKWPSVPRCSKAADLKNHLSMIKVFHVAFSLAWVILTTYVFTDLHLSAQASQDTLKLPLRSLINLILALWLCFAIRHKDLSLIMAYIPVVILGLYKSIYASLP